MYKLILLDLKNNKKETETQVKDTVEYDPISDLFIVNNDKETYIHRSQLELFNYVLLHDNLKPYSTKELTDYLENCKPINILNDMF